MGFESAKRFLRYPLPHDPCQLGEVAGCPGYHHQTEGFRAPRRDQTEQRQSCLMWMVLVASGHASNGMGGNTHKDMIMDMI